MKLYDYPISKEEYTALPHLSTLTERELKEIHPLGFKCRDNLGGLRELVAGTEMFVDQWGAGLSVPERGWRYYRPVFQNHTVDRSEGFGLTKG